MVSNGYLSSISSVQLHDVLRSRRSSCSCSCISDPQRWPYRYIILILVCSIRFACNYIYDIPAAMEGTIIQLMGLDTTHYNLLYSVYSWSVVLGACIGGVIIDKFLGLRLGLLIFIIITNFGQGVIVVGLVVDKYWLMLIGRLLMGLGGEIALFVGDAITSLWFNGGWELNFAFAIVAAVNRLGGASSLYANQPLYDSLESVNNGMLRLGYVFLIDMSLSLIGIASSVVIFIMDKRAEKFIIERQKVKNKKSFSIKDLKSFRLNFWLVTFVSMCYYSSYYPLVTIGQLFYRRKYGLSTNEANVANMLMYLVTIGGPLIGLVVSITGFPLIWGLAGMVLAIGMHGVLALSGGYSIIPFLITPFLAVAYVLFHTTVYPSISLLVDKNKLATAFGILIAMLNFGYSVVDISIALIIDTEGYFVMEAFFIMLQGLGICLLVVLIARVTSGGRNKLVMSGCEARRMENLNMMYEDEQVDP